MTRNYDSSLTEENPASCSKQSHLSVLVRIKVVLFRTEDLTNITNMNHLWKMLNELKKINEHESAQKTIVRRTEAQPNLRERTAK
ncbi:11984_t:CDS:2, partial [Funneliformis geosporum]